jgi:NAD kinase
VTGGILEYAVCPHCHRWRTIVIAPDTRTRRLRRHVDPKGEWCPRTDVTADTEVRPLESFTTRRVTSGA